jgi:hypothetical protein
VTAILGMTYLDGVLMMADTEEWLGGDAKSECDKLYRFIFPIGTVIMGGAGDSHLIECANQELHQFFATGGAQTPDQKITPESTLGALNAFAAKFVKDTAKPYRGFALESVPVIEMLIALNCNNEQTLLFRWTHGRVVWIPPSHHSSVGSGRAQLQPLLRDVQFIASKECMLFHGIRMMFHAKRGVRDVGGKTEAVALQNDGGTHYFGTDAMQKVEEFVRNYEQFKTKVLDTDITTIACADPRIEPELEANVGENLSGLAGIFVQYRNAYKDILKPQLDAQRSTARQSRCDAECQQQDQSGYGDQTETPSHAAKTGDV